MAQTAAAIGQVPFTWEGTDRTGKKVKGKLVAASETAVRQELRRQGVTPTRVRKQSMLFRKQGKVTTADIALFSRQLATMMTAGIPLVQSFDIVGAGHENPAMQKLILAIKGDVEGGTSLADALAKHPLHFDDLFVSLVAAGEQAGALETLLDKIATYKEKTEAIKKKIKKALFYPAAVVVVAIVVTVILMIYVIPEFESLFKGFGADLPAFTRMVIDISKFVQSTGWLLLILVVGGIVGFPAGEEAQPRRAALRRPRDAEDPDHRRDPEQVGDRALRAHAVDDVRGRRAARRGARFRRGRLRQHRLRDGRAAGCATRSRRASACSARWRTPTCSRTWSTR